MVVWRRESVLGLLLFLLLPEASRGRKVARGGAETYLLFPVPGPYSCLSRVMRVGTVGSVGIRPWRDRISTC